MREAVGSIWDLPGIRVIPTNGKWKKDSEGQPVAIMGAGVAKAARDRYPSLDRHLGQRLRTSGNHVARFICLSLTSYSSLTSDSVPYMETVITFPTKDDWRDPSTLALIERSAMELRDQVDGLPVSFQEPRVVMPRVGCGLGGLQWEAVKPILEKYLDDRFIILTPAPNR